MEVLRLDEADQSENEFSFLPGVILNIHKVCNELLDT